MPTIKNGYRRAAIYDPATGTTVQLNDIDPASAGVELSQNTSKNSDGSASYAGDKSSFEFLVRDFSGLSQLQTWAKAETPVRMVAEGVDSICLWEESIPILVEDIYKSETATLSLYRVYGTREGGTHNIYRGKNILYKKFGWADADSDNKPDGYTVTDDGLTESFAAGTFTVTGDGSTGYGISASIVFPIAGATLKSFINNQAGLSNIVLTAKSYADATLGSDTGSPSSVRSLTTPTSTYTIVFDVILTSYTLSGGTDYSFDNPFLGVNQSTIEEVSY